MVTPLKGCLIETRLYILVVFSRAFSLEQLRLKSLDATSEWHKDQVLAPKSSIPGTSSQLSLSIAWNCDDALTRTQLE